MLQKMLNTAFPHLPAVTKRLLLVLKKRTVREGLELRPEAGPPQMACLVSISHTTTLEADVRPVCS